MLSELKKYVHKPALYAPSTAKFWDDEHISKGMLTDHLDPKVDSATRNHAFIERSADWIAQRLPPSQFPHLLDLGCGPGLYAERFHTRGYHVTGVDMSRRSIDYARKSAQTLGYDINYLQQNYLEFVNIEEFDCAVMIYCDYGALSDLNREKLLANVFQALKPGGVFLLDVCSTMHEKDRKESSDWSFHENGFWRENAYLCLQSFFRYDKSETYLNQYIVITDGAVDCYNIWDQLFSPESLKDELQTAGFCEIDLYSDVAGSLFTPESPIICAIGRKGTRTG